MRIAESLVLAMLLVLGPARIARGDDPREAARVHYARGVELATQGRYDDALREFGQAYAISPQYAVLYNIGQAEIALGRPMEAIATLSKYLREGQEQVPKSRREQVQAQIASLEARLGELTITTDRAGAVISIDGREVGRTPLYQPVRVAPGTHTISAASEGAAVLERIATVVEGERQAINLKLPPVIKGATESASAAQAATAAAATSTSARRAPAATFESTSAGPPGLSIPPVDVSRPLATRSSTVAYTLAGVGAGIGVATLVLHLWNNSRYDEWQRENQELRNDPNDFDFRNRQLANNQLADSITDTFHITVGLALVSGALVAGGATLLLTERSRSAKGVATSSPGSPPKGLAFGWGVVSWSGIW